MNKKQKKMLIRIIVATVVLIALIIIPLGENRWINMALFAVPYLIVGYDILKKAFKGIVNKQVFDENFLMAVASLGAMALGEYREAAAVMLFYQIGELFQSYAVGKSRKSISDLMDIRPDYANLERDGETQQVDPDEVEIGSIIVVSPGEKVPIDGVVVSGCSSLNTVALTGESIPREVREGSEVLSGCINMSGVLRIKTTKEFGESTASKILDLVENSTSKKSNSEKFISKFARFYTPIVCGLALALALLPPLVLLFLGKPPVWGTWVYRALTFLVISCPCALVISIPLSFFAGIGGASREGILIKGSNYFETLAKTKTVAFDKTGTVTRGVFEVDAVHHSPLDDKQLLELAAHAESYSSHPISKSLQKAYGKPIDKTRISSVREISGNGVISEVDGKTVAVGSEKLMTEVGANFVRCHSAGTIVHIAVDGEYSGHIVIADTVKPTSAEAISKLRASGVKRTVMLTGDIESVAKSVAEKLGIDDYKSGLLPSDKVTAVEQLLAEKEQGEALAFAGDGINDAPVLSVADVGIAMGALGSDAAIEAADIVLMDDDPLKIPKAIRIAKKCMRIVYENIYFAIGVKVLCLILGALGIANMWLAIFADVGVMIIAVINAIRALRVKNL